MAIPLQVEPQHAFVAALSLLRPPLSAKPSDVPDLGKRSAITHLCGFGTSIISKFKRVEANPGTSLWALIEGMLKSDRARLKMNQLNISIRRVLL
ncbi:MAG TPA: hypothetical protein VF800_17630 [Telluria sp.]